MPPSPSRGLFQPPQSPDALLRSLQEGAAWVRWRQNRHPGPYFPLVQGQALFHNDGMVTLGLGAIVLETVYRWITAAAASLMRPPLPCQHLIRTVPPLAPATP